MRKCSVCKRRGHTKRACPSLFAKGITHSATAIPVRTARDVSSSPHEVHLKKDHRAVVRDVLPVLSDLHKRTPEIREVSLASLLKKTSPRQSHAHTLRGFFPVSGGEVPEDASCFDDGPAPSIFSRWFSFLSSSEMSSIFVLVFALCIILPLPVFGYMVQVRKDSEEIMDVSRHAFTALSRSTVYTVQSRFSDAETSLQEALSAFAKTEHVLDKKYKGVVTAMSYAPFVGKHIRAREDILSAGHEFAVGNTFLLKGISEVRATGTSTRAEAMQILAEHLQYALPHYDEAYRLMLRVDTSVFADRDRQSFGDARMVLGALADDLHDVQTLLSLAEKAGGGEGRRRYLVLFQNVHEMRPTGGFWGSFAEVSVDGRSFSYNIPAGGTYDLQGQLPFFMQPPLPLQIVNARWEFQDLNWSPDFPVAASMAAEWYRKARGVTVDGVLSVNSTMLSEFLAALLPGANTSSFFNPDTVLTDLESHIANAASEGQRDPKKILGDMAGNMLMNLSSSTPETLLRLLLVAHQGLSRKDVQVWFADPSLEKIVSGYNWDGRIPETAGHEDFFSVINANVGGEKSDARITQNITRTVFFAKDGTVKVEAKIVRSHSGSVGEERYGAPNINYVRILVPEGSAIVSSSGFSFPPESAFAVPPKQYEKNSYVVQYENDETFHVGSGTRVTKEFGKTVFGNWVVTHPGTTTTVMVQYVLPFTFGGDRDGGKKENFLSSFLPRQDRVVRYSVIASRQSGVRSTLRDEFVLPEGWYMENGVKDVEGELFLTNRFSEYYIHIPQ